VLVDLLELEEEAQTAAVPRSRHCAVVFLDLTAIAPVLSQSLVSVASPPS